MAQVLVTESYLDDIADAIRDKTGSEDTYTPAQMAGAIEDIQTADEFVLVSKSVTANGTYNPASDSADGYSGVNVNVPNTYDASDNGKVVVNQALTDQTSKSINSNGTHDTTANNSVVVDVPNSYAAADEGKVVDNGELVAQTSTTKTTNGTYDTTLNNEVVVAVPAPVLVQKTITENGTYNPASDNADGYSTVNVNVSGGGGDVDYINYNNVTFVNKTDDGDIGDQSTGIITTSLKSPSRGGLAPNGTEQIIYDQIDLTNKEYLFFIVTRASIETNTTTGVVFGCRANLPITHNEAKDSTSKYKQIINSSSQQSYFIDVSSLTGVYYVYYAANLTYNSYGYCEASFKGICV